MSKEEIKKAMEKVKDKISKGSDKKDSKDEEIEQLTATVKRVQADFENFQKRTEKEKEEFCQFANKELILKLLPLLDSFELALKHAPKKEGFVKGTGNSENSGTYKNSWVEFLEGVELVFSQFVALLEQNGVKKISAKGQKFDPYLHEALLSEKGEKDDVVLEELQTGYMIGEEVLRHTKVKVSKK